MVRESPLVSTDSDSNMRLLIIEDDRESADYLVKAFREVGHVADLASDGEEGLALADSGAQVLDHSRLDPAAVARTMQAKAVALQKQ